jgi:zinc transport system substrate-binding protein
MPCPFRLSVLVGVLLATAPALADVPAVVTDIAPVHSLTAKVMGELGVPGVLVDRGADPHSYQLRPSQARALAGADLIIRVGPELTPWMDRMLAGPAPEQVVGLLAAPATIRRAYGENGSGGSEHDHTGTDPHAWLDPRNAKAWTGQIRDALIAVDPAHAATYRANADRALADLDRLEVETAALLAPVAGSPLVMGHDAYGYFADRFRLVIAGTIEAGDAASAGAAHLRDLRALLSDRKVRCLFPEAGEDTTRTAMLVEGTATQVGPPLDPEGVMLERGPDLYDALIRGVARAISDCVRLKDRDASSP